MTYVILLCSEPIKHVAFAECIGLTSIPEGDWYCPTCEAKGGDAKQKCSKSFSHLFGASNDEKHSDRCQRVVKVSKNALGGCVICK